MGTGGPDSATLQARMDPETPLQGELVVLLSGFSGKEVRVLDVGSGPLTSLGKTWNGRNVIITAVDPLAEQYNEILDRHGLVPPVRAVAGEAEALSKMFPPNHFDLSYSCNAIDHCYDPLLAVREMLCVTKPGGYVYLKHRRNEAEARGYHGLHQWNFFSRDGELFVGNREVVVNITEELRGTAKVACDREVEVLHDGRAYEHVIAEISKRDRD